MRESRGLLVFLVPWEVNQQRRVQSFGSLGPVSGRAAFGGAIRNPPAIALSNEDPQMVVLEILCQMDATLTFRTGPGCGEKFGAVSSFKTGLKWYIGHGERWRECGSTTTMYVNAIAM